jgi:hypothetical protein
VVGSCEHCNEPLIPCNYLGGIVGEYLILKMFTT